MDKNINLTPIRKIRNDFQSKEAIVYMQHRNCKSINKHISRNNKTESQTFQSICIDNKRTLQLNEIHDGISKISSKYKPIKSTDSSNISSSDSHSTKQKVLDDNLHIVQEQNFEIKGDIEVIEKLLLDSYTIETQSEHNTEDQIQQITIEYQNNLKLLYQKMNEITNKLTKLEEDNTNTKKLLLQYQLLHNTTDKTQNSNVKKPNENNKTALKHTNNNRKTTTLQNQKPTKPTNIVIEYEKAKNNYLFGYGSFNKYKELEKQYNKLLHSDDIKNNKEPKNTQDINKTKDKELI